MTAFTVDSLFLSRLFSFHVTKSLEGTANNPQEVANIFREIEEKTGSKIQWESGKFNSTYKRDSLIRLCGSPESVKRAREMVLQNLEIQSNRVVLKIDISHEEHPSLIGRKGGLIQKIMESTNCHIHFPDGNITSTERKSNQVSIAGTPENAETARVMLRALLPFQLSFDIDIPNGEVLNTSSGIWKYIAQHFGLEVHFVVYKNSATVTVRCNLGLIPNSRRSIVGLIEFLSRKCGSDLPPVKVIMDIMPQHHNLVKGPRGSNIQAIAKRTGAKIIFPNLNSELSQKRSIYISGNLDCVYVAWQEVMNSLPISVTFDVSESRETNNNYTEFMQDYNIKVFTQAKPKYHIKSVTVKGPEKFSRQIFQYRQMILNLSPIKFHPDIEDINNALAIYGCYIESQQSAANKMASVSNVLSSFYTPVENLTNFLSSANCFQSVGNSFIQAPLGYNASSPPSADVPSFNRMNFKKKDGYHYPSVSISNSAHTPMYHSWGQNFSNNNKNEAVINNSNNISVNDASINLDSYMGPDSPPSEQKVANVLDIFKKKLRAYEAIHRNIESTQVPSNLWAGYGFSQSMPAAPSAYKNRDMSRQNHSCASLESDSSGSSQESWDGIILANYIDENVWPEKEENVLSMSNVFDFKTNICEPINCESGDILPSILFQVGLYNYVDIFLKEEIDYAAFLLLSEMDLAKMGINYQGRMKITCLIRELQDNKMKMKTFDLTPGAGRKFT